MPTEHAPVATGFFPAGRLGLGAGLTVAVIGVLLWPRDATPRVEAPVATDVPVAVVVGAAPPRDVKPVFVLPLRGPVVAHVWLENCADCMSAFAEHKRIEEAGELRDVPQMNVAYGASTPEFRAQYRVEDNYAVDADGSLVVRPFSIGSFTTLVLDGDGALVLRDRPDHAGYTERVRDAWARARR